MKIPSGRGSEATKKAGWAYAQPASFLRCGESPYCAAFAFFFAAMRG
jgi:hypothetical protein